jgi:hypothetical protein
MNDIITNLIYGIKVDDGRYYFKENDEKYICGFEDEKYSIVRSPNYFIFGINLETIYGSDNNDNSFTKVIINDLEKENDELIKRFKQDFPDRNETEINLYLTQIREW